MKSIFISLGLVLWPFFLYSQNTNWESFEIYDSSSFIRNAFNFHPTKNYTLFIYTMYDSNIIDGSTFSKIKMVDSNGVKLVEKTIRNDSLKANEIFWGYYDELKEELLLFGGASQNHSKGSRSYFTKYRFDINLNMLSFELIALTNFYPLKHLECTPLLNGNSYICSAVQYNQIIDTLCQTTILIVNDSIKVADINKEINHSKIAWNFIQSPYDSQFYSLKLGFHKLEGYKSKNKIGLDIFSTSNTKDVRVFNNKILVSSPRGLQSPDSLDNFGHFVAYINKDFSFEKSNGIGKFLENIALIQNQLDFKSNNTIYLASSNEKPNQLGPFLYFQIAQFDKDLKLKWELNYSLNEKRIRPIGITATYDEGVIVWGGVLSVINNNLRYDPFYIKFDSNGEIVSIENISVDEISIIRQFPNPTTDHFKLKFQSIPYSLNIDINDQTGKVLYKGKIEEKDFQLDVQNFPPGQYFYKIYVGISQVIKTASFIKI